MASLYYLMASLPMLRTEGEPPISYEKFLDLCRSAVSEKTFHQLEALSLDSSEGPLFKEWSQFYSVVKEELIYQRSVRLGRPSKIPENREPKVVSVVNAAVNNTDPLTAEQLLLRIEFEKLDDLVGYHNFDDCALFGYGLKLKLLERKLIFNQESGQEEFQTLLGNLREQVFQM